MGRRGSSFLSLVPHQTGLQVFQLPVESHAHLVQEGGVPGSRGVLCEQEVRDVLEHLVEDRDGLALLDLDAIYHCPEESEVFCVIQTG